MFKTFSGRERSIFFEKEAFYADPAELEFNEKGGIGILRGRKVVSINSEDQEVVLDDGRKIKYGKCKWLLLVIFGKAKSFFEYIFSNT